MHISTCLVLVVRRLVGTLGVNPISETKVKAKYDAIVVGGGSMHPKLSPSLHGADCVHNEQATTALSRLRTWRARAWMSWWSSGAT